MRYTLRGFIITIVSLLLSVALVAAQAACDDIVLDAFDAIGENCDGVGRNEVCYGYNQVEASFFTEVADDFFSLPADLAEVADLQTIRTAPLDVENQLWGVAVMNIQADLPNTLPGQSVTTILLGDVEVSNAVDSESAFVPSNGVDATVAVAAGANIRSGPGTNFNVIGGARNEEILQADGVSSDGEWLRVAYLDRPAWVSLSVIEIADDDLASLPELSSELRTPMQSFFIRTGIGEIACEDIPSNAMFIQGPENIEITLTINGADVTVGSSGIVYTFEEDGEFFMENIVFDGVFDWDGVQVRRGQWTRLCLSELQDLNGDGIEGEREVTCDPAPPTPAPIDTLEEFWCSLETLPQGLMNYRLNVPCSDDVVTTGTGSSSGSASQSQVSGVDCSSFVIPAQTIIATNFTLDWTDVPGATSYVVAIFDANNLELNTFSTTASSLATNGANFPPVGYVDVRAYQDGVYACFARLNFTRAPDPNPSVPTNPNPSGPAVFSAFIAFCDTATTAATATIAWSNAPTGAVNVTYIDGATGVPVTQAGSGTDGSLDINGSFGFVTITVTSGTETINLGGC